MKIQSTIQNPLPCHNHVSQEHKHTPGHQDPKLSKGLSAMEVTHVAHDVAMIGMNLPGMGHHHHAHGSHSMAFDPMSSWCGTSPPPEAKAGMFDPLTQGSPSHQGLTALSAVAAVGAGYHGIKMLQHGHYAHGANHLLMGAGSGVMAIAMATGSSSLHTASSVLMGAHGAAEVGLGVQSFTKAESTKDKALALSTVVHGACLAAAQLTNNALITVPLYLGMGAATATQVALSHSGN